MPRLLYRMLMLVIAALLPLKLWWRGRRQPAYRQHWRERYGWYATPSKPVHCWIHAVSVGETRAAQPLILAWLQAHPTQKMLLTHGTPTGRETGQQLFAAELATGRLQQAYLPIDTPGAVRRFLRHFQPALGVLMETELWFELIDAAHVRGLKLALVSARLSVRSARGYARLGALTRKSLQALDLVAAQTADDARRLAALGARSPLICGNLKFDVNPPTDSVARGQALRGLLGIDRTVLMAASTREGEEALLLDALPALTAPAQAPLLLLLVPRHPQRFDAVAALLQARGISFQRRSQLHTTLEASVQVVLGDSMGEMYSYYAACDLAVMGGSLQPLGGQNLIEAAAMGVPTVLGPHMFNFAEISQAAVAAGAACAITQLSALPEALNRLLLDPALQRRLSAAASQFAASHRGSTQRLLQALDSHCAT